MSVILMVDVECISAPGGRLGKKTPFCEFELGWSAAEFRDGAWHRHSGSTAVPLSEMRDLSTVAGQVEKGSFVQALRDGDLGNLPVCPHVRETLEWHFKQGYNESLANRVEVALNTTWIDFMCEVETKLQPLMTAADSIWASELPLDTLTLSMIADLPFAKKRCFRTMRKANLMPLYPTGSAEHVAVADAEWQLDQLLYNMFYQSNPAARRVLRDAAGIGNLPAPSVSFFKHKLPTE